MSVHHTPSRQITFSSRIEEMVGIGHRIAIGIAGTIGIIIIPSLRGDPKLHIGYDSMSCAGCSASPNEHTHGFGKPNV